MRGALVAIVLLAPACALEMAGLDGSADTAGADAEPGSDAGAADEATAGGDGANGGLDATVTADADAADVVSDARCGDGSCSVSLRVKAYLDDRSRFVIQGSSAHWHHVSGAAPGRWQGANEPTYLDGVAWTPTWPAAGENRDCNCDSSSTTVGALAAKPQVVTLVPVTMRDGGTSNVTQQPSAANGYAAVVELYDPMGGAGWVEVQLAYETN